MDRSFTEPGKVIAFYSFKGGTGRSMALANVGCILAQHPDVGGSVLLVDWDLEAPGLHRYFRKYFFRAFKGSEEAQEKTPGLIDLFIELRDRIDLSEIGNIQDFESAKRMLGELPLAEYVVRTDIPGLHLIKAGCFDSEYAEKVGRFEWSKLYERSPFLIRAFADRLATEYRYVLIDSRTGLTDTSGICTMLLPEILVAVFTPNRQSLNGVIDLIREASQYRSQSDDLRPLIVYPLPSRIEASEPSLRQLWRLGDSRVDITGFQKSFEEAFKHVYGISECNLAPYFDDIQIQHVPRYAYGEDIAAIVEETRDRLSLTRSFQKFSGKLIAGELPWELATSTEDSVVEEDLAGIYDQVREQAAAAYLRSIAVPAGRLKSGAFWFDMFPVLSGLGASSGFLVLLLDGTLNDGTRWLALAFAASSTLPVFFWNLVRKKREAFMEVERQISAFKNRVPPYDREDSLERLRDRIEPVLVSSGVSVLRKSSGKIFISYRRGDGRYARRLYNSLSETLGRDNLFMDVESIPLGADFREHITMSIGAADVILVVIGPGWRSSNISDDPSDFVRLEIASALRRKKLVIPVLVGGSSMPAAQELPQDISGLSFRQAIVLSDRSWEVGTLGLAKEIGRITNA